MRHRKRRTRLNRHSQHLKTTLSMIAKSLFIHQSVKTTLNKAKEARRVAEHLITIAKKNDLNARRNVFSVLRDKNATTRLFKDIMPLFANRIGGYTRIIPLNYRRGDGARLVLLELTDKVPAKGGKEDESKKLKTQKTAPKAALPRTEKVKTGEAKKDASKKTKIEAPKTAPKIEPQVKEEKAVEDVKKEKAKKEEKKIRKIEKKGFLNRFFRRRTNM